MSPPTPGHDMVTSILASEAVLGLSQNPAHACAAGVKKQGQIQEFKKGVSLKE